jgi:putative photosynthetic complex assembly protein
MSAIDLKPFPRLPLVAAACLISLSVTSTAIARFSRADETPPVMQIEARLPQSLAHRTLTFLNQPDESLIVIDVESGAQVAHIAKQDAGFIYGVMRGLRRSRMIHGAPIDPTVTIAHWPDGRMTLTDPQANTMIDLNAFGADNRAVFARYLANENNHSKATAS